MLGSGVGIGMRVSYPRSHVVNPKGPEVGSYRVMRGGGWNEHRADTCVPLIRDSAGGPSKRFSYVGFRLVRTAK